jgi:tRNA-dihydrouridine synthase C
MIGRGAVADPFLALRIKGLIDERPSTEDWHALLPRIAEYWEKVHTRVWPAMRPVG